MMLSSESQQLAAIRFTVFWVIAHFRRNHEADRRGDDGIDRLPRPGTEHVYPRLEQHIARMPRHLDDDLLKKVFVHCPSLGIWKIQPSELPEVYLGCGIIGAGGFFGGVEGANVEQFSVDADMRPPRRSSILVPRNPLVLRRTVVGASAEVVAVFSIGTYSEVSPAVVKLIPVDVIGVHPVRRFGNLPVHEDVPGLLHQERLTASGILSREVPFMLIQLFIIFVVHQGDLSLCELDLFGHRTSVHQKTNLVNALDKTGNIGIMSVMDKELSKAKAIYEQLTKQTHSRIIDMYFNQKVENMAEIARKVGYSRERVRQIIEKESERRKSK